MRLGHCKRVLPAGILTDLIDMYFHQDRETPMPGHKRPYYGATDMVVGRCDGHVSDYAYFRADTAGDLHNI